MILLSIVLWLLVKRWWLGSMLAGLGAAAWALPALLHLSGAQRGQAFATLWEVGFFYFAVTAALYGLRYVIREAWRAVRQSPTA